MLILQFLCKDQANPDSFSHYVSLKLDIFLIAAFSPENCYSGINSEESIRHYLILLLKSSNKGKESCFCAVFLACVC